MNNIKELIKDKSPEEALALLAKEFPGKIVFSTSLGYEDQVISHFIFYQHKVPQNDHHNCCIQKGRNRKPFWKKKFFQTLFRYKIKTW
jgi:hypothetical protein